MIRDYLRSMRNKRHEAEVRRLQTELSNLREELAVANSKLRIQEVEIDELSAVIARNRKRVEAETALAVRSTGHDEPNTE